MILLSNKYYTADVCLLPCAFTSLGETLLGTRSSHSLEGIALVTAPGCGRVEQRLEELCLLEQGTDIRILIVDRPAAAPPADTHVGWHDRLQSSCIEHCTEFCEVCTEDAGADAALHADHPQEPQGLRRVLEALDAHLWPQMRMHAQASPSPDAPDGLAAAKRPSQQGANAARTLRQPSASSSEASSSGSAECSTERMQWMRSSAGRRPTTVDAPAAAAAHAPSASAGHADGAREPAAHEALLLQMLQDEAGMDIAREMQGA